MFCRYCRAYKDMYRDGVVAYTSNIRIIVNGHNVNKDLYPPLNYRPNNNMPYYSYVPISVFDKVGAVVTYDKQANVFNVSTDYYSNKEIMMQNQNRIAELINKNSKLEKEMRKLDYVQYQGKLEGLYKFSGSDTYWTLQSNVGNIDNKLIVGNFYKVVEEDGGVGSWYLTILDENKENVVFRVNNHNRPTGLIYIGRDENGLYLFSWERNNITSKFKVLDPSNADISLEPNRTYVVQRNDNFNDEYFGKAYDILGTDITIAALT